VTWGEERFHGQNRAAYPDSFANGVIGRVVNAFLAMDESAICGVLDEM